MFTFKTGMLFVFFNNYINKYFLLNSGRVAILILIYMNTVNICFDYKNLKVIYLPCFLEFDWK